MRRHLFPSLAIILLSSCNPNAFVHPTFRPSEVRQMNYLEPLSYISMIQQGNRPIPNDSLSRVSGHLLDSIVQNTRQFAAIRKIETYDPELRRQIEIELRTTVALVTKAKRVEGIALPPGVRALLEERQQRFGLATVSTGFGRRKGNYGGQIAKGLGVGLLTLGMVVPVPVKTSSTLYALIFDTQRDEIVYFCRTLPVEKSPTDAYVLRSQYAKLFANKKYSKH